MATRVTRAVRASMRVDSRPRVNTESFSLTNNAPVLLDYEKDSEWEIHFSFVYGDGYR